MRYALRSALVAVMCTAACSGGSAPSSSSNPSTPSSFARARVTRAIRRDGHTWLRLDSLPVGATEKQAQWILERPAINGSLVDLANYDSAVMTDAWAEDTTNTLHDYWTDGDAFSNEVYMKGTSPPSRILSEAIGFGRGKIYFFWDAYN